MERVWACINGDEIVNVLVGDGGVPDLVGNHYERLLEVTDMDPQPGILWKQYEDGSWRCPAPKGNFVWDGSMWIPPVPRPEEGEWVWDIMTDSWVPAPGQS